MDNLTKKLKTSFIYIIVIIVSYGCNSLGSKKTEEQRELSLNSEASVSIAFKVLSLNIWKEEAEGAFEALVEVILQSQADIMMFCEVNNAKDFGEQMVGALKNKGKTYYYFDSGISTMVLSKWPIKDGSETISKAVGQLITKAIVDLGENKSLTVYAAHLDYTHYACYLPRGYDGNSWKKLPEPIVDVNLILQENLASVRDEAIDVFVKDAKQEQDKGNIILLAGDFNEPSHLDWTEATKNQFDHNGAIVPWQNSLTLQENGYLDAYRVKYPNPVTHPGFTWPAFTADVELSELSWAKEADERDRIDFIYYNKNERLVLEDVIIVGPSESILKGERMEEGASDKFLEPMGKWLTDHKGVLATFKIK
ncbi:endonuclease/exonuclease/phosphatase family protein [Snuella sedimenti]|uniref:Endonuclease/exonuclease/phosphatase family protein n=1 Tax=Snuella sedimenti TaxID=2798802 RepID=A0A8J7LXW6_9FLAO|nr:endonuclease/exonuclease/phosphatase family protein [Snuella sedimenti]MBJ6367481.1 endonuclease/exonuclease/phosphatase family protein [Snuella sedimenti]